MPNPTYGRTQPGAVGEVRAASASKGTAVTTTLQRTRLPLGTQWVSLLPYNFTTAVVVRFNLNPWLTVLTTFDGLATASEWSSVAQDNQSTTLVSLGGFPTTGAIYIGSYVPFGGVEVDAGTVNAVAATLTLQSSGPVGWESLTATDGTASGGATFAQSGNITWTVPTDWAPQPLDFLEGLGDGGAAGMAGRSLYWVKVTVSAALTAGCTIQNAYSINRSTAYAELVTGQAFSEAVDCGPGGITSVSCLTDAGTANLIINTAANRFAF